mgnify:CR=1 FL=1
MQTELYTSSRKKVKEKNGECHVIRVIHVTIEHALDYPANSSCAIQPGKR